jgi:hypothetical protein
LITAYMADGERYLEGTHTVRFVADELLTSGQVAKRLGINPSTLARYVREGKLKPAVTLPSGHHRWTWEDVLEQLRAQQGES